MRGIIVHGVAPQVQSSIVCGVVPVTLCDWAQKTLVVRLARVGQVSGVYAYDVSMWA